MSIDESRPPRVEEQAHRYRLAQARALLRALRDGIEPKYDERGKVVPSIEDYED